MKVKLYNCNIVVGIVDCNDIDHIDNPCYNDDCVQVHMRDHTTKLADDVVFMMEGEL